MLVTPLYRNNLSIKFWEYFFFLNNAILITYSHSRLVTKVFFHDGSPYTRSYATCVWWVFHCLLEVETVHLGDGFSCCCIGQELHCRCWNSMVYGSEHNFFFFLLRRLGSLPSLSIFSYLRHPRSRTTTISSIHCPDSFFPTSLTRVTPFLPFLFDKPSLGLFGNPQIWTRLVQN